MGRGHRRNRGRCRNQLAQPFDHWSLPLRDTRHVIVVIVMASRLVVVGGPVRREARDVVGVGLGGRGGLETDGRSGGRRCGWMGGGERGGRRGGESVVGDCWLELLGGVGVGLRVVGGLLGLLLPGEELRVGSCFVVVWCLVLVS